MPIITVVNYWWIADAEVYVVVTIYVGRTLMIQFVQVVCLGTSHQRLESTFLNSWWTAESISISSQGATRLYESTLLLNRVYKAYSGIKNFRRLRQFSGVWSELYGVYRPHISFYSQQTVILLWSYYSDICTRAYSRSWNILKFPSMYNMKHSTSSHRVWFGK